MGSVVLDGEVGNRYCLDRVTLATLGRMGSKSAQNLMDALEGSKRRSLDRFLTGLGIRHVGANVAKTLARRFRTLEALGSATLEELERVPGLGPIIASSAHDFFHDPENRRLLDSLRAASVLTGPVQATGHPKQDVPCGEDFRAHGDLAEADAGRGRSADPSLRWQGR